MPQKKTKSVKINEPDKVRTVKQISQLEHVKRKSMWVGSKEIGETEMYCIDGDKMSLTKINFAPAWYKIVDEIVVNAIDQWVNFSTKVTKIKISFNEKTGAIAVYNNGPSISIAKVKNLHGIKMYIPQMIASEFLTGDNLDDDDDNERVTGGTNGCGIKLTNAFSDYLIITITDTKKKKHYIQKFKDRLEIIEPPVLRALTKDDKESFTQIEFLPSYEAFGYKKGYTSSITENLERLIKTRAYQAAAFTEATVYYNDNEIKIPEIKTRSVKKNTIFYNFSYMFLPTPENGLWSTKLTSKKYPKFPWELCIGISDGAFRQISLINGIYVHGGGTHMKHIQKQIIENLQQKVEKKNY